MTFFEIFVLSCQILIILWNIILGILILIELELFNNVDELIHAHKIIKGKKYIDTDGTKLRITDNGIVRKYYKNRKLHRLVGPAVESYYWWYWYKEGKCHRIGGPAGWRSDHILNSNESEYSWWVNGKKVEIYYICG